MAYRVIQLKTGRRQPDDKDHFKNKRLRLGGPLLADLFRVSFRNLTRDIKYQLERIGVKGPIITVSAAVRPGIITERFQHALATGNWGRGRVGITQLLDRTNYISTLSHLRRLQSPLSRSQPNFEARDLHPTHWGRLCPNETPEGSNCGLVKNLALSASIAVGVNPDKIKQLLFEMGTVPAYEASIELRISGAKVYDKGGLICGCATNARYPFCGFAALCHLGQLHPPAKAVSLMPHHRQNTFRAVFRQQFGDVRTCAISAIAFSQKFQGRQRIQNSARRSCIGSHFLCDSIGGHRLFAQHTENIQICRGKKHTRRLITSRGRQ